jgi:hypothetical protein
MQALTPLMVETDADQARPVKKADEP